MPNETENTTKMRPINSITAITIAGLLVPATAAAGEPESAGVGASGSLGTNSAPKADADADAKASKPKKKRQKKSRRSKAKADDERTYDRKEEPWIKRWAPEPNMGEIGVYGGIFMPHKDIELFAPDESLPQQGQLPFRSVAPELGIRGGYYPIRFFGVEAEAGLMPTRFDESDERVNLWTVRGQLVAQLGLWSVTPFVTAGFGALGVGQGETGRDVDPAFHFGGGVKVYLNRWINLRVDLRDVVAPGQGVKDGVTNNFEALLGLSVTLGRSKGKKKEPDPVPVDRDGDGVPDDQDKCPDVAGEGPDGCPPPAPAPEPEPEPADSDGDGITDDQDKCVDQAETKNGYQDTDGCPDEVPEDVKAFDGVIDGIQFDTGKATIKSGSTALLEKATGILNEYPDIRLEIGGHTDSTGDHDENMDLSKRRAESVKKYLIDNGIDGARLETRGYGPDKPIASNDTKDGRAKNRRIEFHILK